MKKLLLSTVVTLALYTAQAQVPTNGLVEHFSFDNTHLGTNGHDLKGTAGSMNYVDDRNSNTKAAHYVSNGNYALRSETIDLPTGDNARTIAFWFKHTTSDNNPRSLVNYTWGSGADAAFYISSNGSGIEIGKVNGATYTSFPVSITNMTDWVHVAVTYASSAKGGSVCKVYINNALSTTQSFSLNTSSGTGTQLRIGYSPGGTGAYYGNFMVDDLFIYNKELSSNEITEVYNNAPATCIVNIPDASFKSALVNNIAINTNEDTEIQCSEADAYTGTIDIPSLGISDLTGIEAFTNITKLYCSFNTIDTLPLGNKPHLITISARSNNIRSADLSNYTALEQVDLKDNQLSSLNIKNGNNSALTYFLTAGNNNLTCIQVDDAGYSNNNWTTEVFEKPAAAAYNEDCSVITSLDDLTTETAAFSIYPNPANDILNITTDKAAQVSIINSLGVVVQTLKMEDGKKSVDVSNLEAGLYLVQLGNGKSLKLIKE